MARVATLRRRSIRDSARFPAQLAVERIRQARHREHGLHPCETSLARLVMAWVAGGWQPTTIEEIRA